MEKKPSSMERTTEMIDRESDLAYVMDCIVEADCCSVVGVSNIGKSTLMRALSLPEVHDRHLRAKSGDYLFVYIDFNLTSQMSEQGFYEVILRDMLELLEDRQAEGELRAAIRQAYEKVITSASPFLIPLAFEDALEAVTEQYAGMLVLLFDEFDEVFSEIDARVFVRLRALKDRHWPQLCYVTATGHVLPEIRRERQVGEFCELFAPHTHHLAPLDEAASGALVAQWAAEEDAEFTPQDVDFVLQCAGGHPALLMATSRVLTAAKEEAVLRPASGSYAQVREQLNSDEVVRLECAKLWNDLSPPERETLILLLSSHEVTSGLDMLARKGLVSSAVESRPALQETEGVKVFSGLFEGFAKRQQLMRHRGPQGIRIDVDSGDVWVDGELAPVLTELEYKLLLLLYGNLDKICDKYQIVESVWGESYIDEVDDARIEKLISRLRHKIEPVPEEPRYLITIRGRGYKLVSPD
jgi:hypothetical protein